MNNERIPLSEKMRPKSLSEFVGQDDLVGPGKIISRIVENKAPVNLILWGPPGTGKTTLARIIANETKADFIEISAVTSGKKDVENVIERARQNWNLGIRTVLFVDEIHRFNKAQQDAFLPHVESGLINLIGATTENPSFEIIAPLLSRSRVLVLHHLSKKNVFNILKNATKELGGKINITDEAIDFIAEISAGDARNALGNLDLVVSLARKAEINRENIKEFLQKTSPIYDKRGDSHYDTISAFIKSMRGGDVDATLYYLARMINSGEDAKFIARRMMIFASEDIGLAGNGALGMAVNASLAVERVGMPEGKYILFHTASALALAKKSRKTTESMYRALDVAEKTKNSPIPLHIRNPETKLMKDLGYAKGYKWDAGFKHEKGFLPEDVTEKIFF